MYTTKRCFITALLLILINKHTPQQDNITTTIAITYTNLKHYNYD